MAELVTGSRILQPIAEDIGLPIDQVNVIAVELVALVTAFLYRNFLSHDRVSTVTRHVVALVLGLFFGHFCFGSEIFHLAIQCTICYIAIKTIPATKIHWVVFILAMAYLLFVHLKRVLVDVEGYLIDISGPLMICTLKVTVVAFGLHDDCHGDDKVLRKDHRKHELKEIPSMLEFYSYIFYFQGIIVGPPSFFADYRDFISGKVYKIQSGKRKEDNGTSASSSNNSSNGTFMQNGISQFATYCPSPVKPVILKLLQCVFWFLVHSMISPLFPVEDNVEDDFAASHSWFYRFIYLDISLMCARAKYYTAWLLGDAIHNASGFGFNGYSKTGEARWDRVTSIEPFSVETATSLKLFMDNWNIQTMVWFRYICFNRVAFYPILCTFALSAMWHGCFPGYYFTFINGAFFTMAAKQVRRHIRPFFLRSPYLKKFYDVITVVGTRITIGYVVVPFVVLHLEPSLRFYRNMYWCLHIIGCVILFISPLPWSQNKHIGSIKKEQEKESLICQG